MSGFDNEVLYCIGERLQPSTAQAITIMQKTADDVSVMNISGSPEGVASANPSSIAHDRASGSLYLKQTGTGNTGWSAIPTESGFTSIVVQTFTASGTYTPTAGMKYCTVELVGGGGGGGGNATTDAITVSCAAGGGGGGYARETFSAADIGVSKAVIVGVAGTAGAAGSGNGGGGGSTSLGGSMVSAQGGAGGNGAAAQAICIVTGSLGGFSATGTLNIPGIASTSTFGSAALGFALGSDGGNSVFGAGGVGPNIAAGGFIGNNGRGFGGGGSGAVNGINQTQRAGGAGTAGFVIVTEFI